MASGKNRKVIGIIYNINPKWMGGVIYILNAIKVLNWLEDNEKPLIVIFYRKELQRFVDELNYPYLEKIKYDFPSINTIFKMSFFVRKNLLLDELYKHRKVDAFFPVLDLPLKVMSGPQIVSWYADLQHKHYPKFFSLKKRIGRNVRIKLMLRNTSNLVLSSNSVKNDFEQFFGLRRIKTHIFHFASVIDNFDFTGYQKILEHKSLPEQYFMVSNQFHRHKNHKLVLEALVLLKAKGIMPVVIFTGKLPENDQSSYFQQLRRLIEKNNLNNQVHFLGVMSRHEQLSLMRYAQAVIQPSLFEGWSTVIEDAISLQTPVLASDIEVNREQLGDWSTYFDPEDPNKLAELMQEYNLRTDFSKIIYQPYNDRMKEAAKSFISIFN